MNEPIISPWLIYLINLADNLRGVFIIGVALSSLAFVTFLSEPFLNENERKQRAKGRKIAAIAFIIFGLLSVFIPPQNVIYEMIAAEYITPANLQQGEDKIFQLIERCIEIVNKKGMGNNG